VIGNENRIAALLVRGTSFSEAAGVSFPSRFSPPARAGSVVGWGKVEAQKSGIVSDRALDRIACKFQASSNAVYRYVDMDHTSLPISYRVIE